MTVKTNFDTYQDCWLQIERYFMDSSPAIIIHNKYGVVARITTCIPGGGADETHSFIDTNNYSWAEDFIKKYKLGQYTGMKEVSGYCEYPLYEFDMEMLKKYAKQD